MDVAAVLDRLVGTPVLRDRLATAAGRPLTAVDRHRLAALAFLHDVGKLHPGFQAKGWPSLLWTGPLRGHTAESWTFFDLASRSPGHPFHPAATELPRWGDAFAPLLLAMFAHHGRPLRVPPTPAIEDWDEPRLAHYRWRDEARCMADALRAWFAPAFAGEDGVELPDASRFHHLVAGLAALADWIGSDTRFFPYAPVFDPGYDRVARGNARRAVAAIGLAAGEGRAAAPPPTFLRLTGHPEPRPAQAAVGAVPAGDRLVILEAETGSGKTEAALWRYARLRAAGRVSGLYFAVPTRAAASQLHRRIHDAVVRLDGPDPPDTVLAIPGTLRAGDYGGRRLPNWRVRWDDDADAPRRWAAEHATRFLAAEVSVGTVDQAMLAALRTKHAHLRGSALSRSLLVVDEVHASDAYMTEILKRLVDDHLAVGGYAMLMSATLGSRARARWRGEPVPDLDAARGAPYPAVWTSRGATSCAAPGAAARTRVVHPGTRSTMGSRDAAALAVEKAGEGARVLVIRNTVDAAVETWQAVRDAGGGDLLLRAGDGPALHHGRFAAEDRALLDRAVEDALAPDHPDRAAGGRVVVGTQTLEQSLDIDADHLVTDLCPIDVLLQRVGRLHRHDLPRPPSFEDARLVVLLPAGGLEPLTAPGFENGLGAWKTRDGEVHSIYGDLACLELTASLLRGTGPWRIPEMNRDLVEGATHPARIEALLAGKGEAWRRYQSDIGGSEAARRGLAALVALDRGNAYLDMRFPSSDERVMTRLSEHGVVLDFEPVAGPFGVPVSRIPLPAHWSRGIPPDDEVAVSRTDDGLRLRIGASTFRYSRAGLRRERHPV